MINKKKAFSQYYEIFRIINQNFNIEDDAKILGNKMGGHNIDEDNNMFDLNYKDICVTVIKNPGTVPEISNDFEYWVGNGFYWMEIKK